MPKSPVKGGITLTAGQQQKLLQQALALPENQRKVTAVAAKALATRTDRVYKGLLVQAGEILRHPSMTQRSQVVRYRELQGFDENDYPRYGAGQFRVNWPQLSPLYAKRKPGATKDLFWLRTGRTAAAYAAGISRRRSAVRAKAIRARLAKGGKLQSLFELQIPSLPWPLNDLLVKPFVYGINRTPSYSFSGYRSRLAVLMFLEKPYGKTVDMDKRRRRFAGDLTGARGEELDNVMAMRRARNKGGGTPARPWLRQLASTFRRDMIRALAGR